MFWQVLFVVAAAAVSSSDGCSKICPCRNEIEAISSRLVNRERAEQLLVADLAQNLGNMSQAVGDLSQGVAEVRQLKMSLEQLNERVEQIARHLSRFLTEEDNCTDEEDGAQPEASPKECPSGWVSHNGSCYYFQLSKIRLTYDTAQQQCNTKYAGSNLVAIETRDEYNFIKGYLNGRYSSIRNSIENGFITSGKRVNGQWKWMSTGDDIDFIHVLQWGSGEPDNQVCLSFWPQRGFEMADVECSSFSRQFICEI